MIKSFFKYMPARLAFFDNFYLRVSTRQALNDPFEFSPSSPLWAKFSLNKEDVQEEEISRFERSESALKEAVYGQHGIISLTETNDNLLMWSHYADEHKGVVVEFDAKHDFFNRNYLDESNRFVGAANRVLYRKERFSAYRQGEIESIYEVFFHKSDEWEYEKEHRLLLPLKKSDIALINKDMMSTEIDEGILSKYNDRFYEYNCDDINHDAMYFYQIPCDAIRSISFGCDVDRGFISAVKEKISKNSDMSHVSFFEARMNSRDYKLDFELSKP